MPAFVPSHAPCRCRASLPDLILADPAEGNQPLRLGLHAFTRTWLLPMKGFHLDADPFFNRIFDQQGRAESNSW